MIPYVRMGSKVGEERWIKRGEEKEEETAGEQANHFIKVICGCFIFFYDPSILYL